MYRTVWKVSVQSGKFLDSLESFRTVLKVSGRTVWKLSRQFGKFPNGLESLRTVWKLSKQAGKVSDSLESFQTVLKVSRQCQSFPDMCPTVNKHGMKAKAIYALWALLCRKSYLRTFGAFLSQKRFTGSIWKVFALYILPTGKF